VSVSSGWTRFWYFNDREIKTDFIKSVPDRLDREKDQLQISYLPGPVRRIETDGSVTLAQDRGFETVKMEFREFKRVDADDLFLGNPE
jgi:hypothetical protein